MALPANLILECNASATAGNVNGGGFNPANASFMTDLTTDANTANTSSPVCSSATYNFQAADQGHWLYVQSGTNWTQGWYQIASVAANKATLTAGIGTAVLPNASGKFYDLNTVAGCATVGTPTGGVFGIDYSQSTGAKESMVDLVLVTSTTMTSASNPFGPNHVGNIIHITAGTNFTKGWFEILSVAAVTATVDRSAGTGGSTAGTAAVGGAISLGTAAATGVGDASFFALLGANGSATAAPRCFIKSGSYAPTDLGATGSANAAWPSYIQGYFGNRTVRPAIGSGNQPVLDCSKTTRSDQGNYNDWYNLIIKSSVNTDTNGIINGAGTSSFYNCVIQNTSTGNGALNMSYYYCDLMALRGSAIYSASNVTPVQYVFGCYIHDSNKAVEVTSTTAHVLLNNIIANCKTANVNFTGSATVGYLHGNTIYGSENKINTAGLSITTGTKRQMTNNIIYGFATGVVQATANTVGFDDYNNYFNNTADVTASTGWQKGTHDTAIDPGFSSNITQRSGSTATTTAGNHLVQSGATFQTWGIVAGDILYVSSGTGPTAGMYQIASVDSETQITTTQTLTANATANKVWQITKGTNFAIANALKATGFPGTIPSTSSVGYMDVGAVQIQAGASGGSFTFGS